jgi:hypothetical protein
MFFRPKVTKSSSDTTLGGMKALGLKPDSLRRIKIFADLEDRQLESFLHYLALLSFKPYTQVVRKGEHGDDLPGAGVNWGLRRDRWQGKQLSRPRDATLW